MLGPLLVWPIPIIVLSIIFWMNFSELREWTLLVTVSLPILFHLSNKIALVAWDLHITARNARRINRFRRHAEGQAIVDEVASLLAALK